jgi:hypothetical protein
MVLEKFLRPVMAELFRNLDDERDVRFVLISCPEFSNFSEMIFGKLLEAQSSVVESPRGIGLVQRLGLRSLDLLLQALLGSCVLAANSSTSKEVRTFGFSAAFLSTSFWALLPSTAPGSDRWLCSAVLLILSPSVMALPGQLQTKNVPVVKNPPKRKKWAGD